MIFYTPSRFIIFQYIAYYIPEFGCIASYTIHDNVTFSKNDCWLIGTDYLEEVSSYYILGKHL